MRADPVKVAKMFIEVVADLTYEEADAVIEAVRLKHRVIAGPTTNGDALRLLKRLEDSDL